jgi:hypothetical protein
MGIHDDDKPVLKNMVNNSQQINPLRLNTSETPPTKEKI